MKKLNQYIIEKFRINSKNVKNNQEILYDSDNRNITWEDLELKLDNINKNLKCGFICFHKSIVESNNLLQDFHCYDDILDSIVYQTIPERCRNNDCQVLLVEGHIEFNYSIDRNKYYYYIYAIKQDIYHELDKFFDNKSDYENLDFLLKPGNIIKIK